MPKLINNYHYELFEDHHHPGSGHYEVVVIPDDNISSILPYLNAVLEDTNYDDMNKVLIGGMNHQRYAFRPREIRAGVVTNPADASKAARDVIDLVNKVWENREGIVPSLKERKIPPTFEIYKVLPRKNCRQCGCATCLAFAGKLRNGELQLDSCPLIMQPEYVETRKKIEELFS